MDWVGLINPVDEVEVLRRRAELTRERQDPRSCRREKSKDQRMPPGSTTTLFSPS
jgi:hypothetical protein